MKEFPYGLSVEGNHINRVARNIFFSLVGFAWPVVLLLVATPVIVRGLGEAGYGVWALVGNIAGYLSVFNSLQTAGAKYLAEYIELDDRASIAKLLGTSLVFNLAIGACGAGAIVVFAEPLSTAVFSIPPQIQEESVIAFRLAGVGFLLSTTGWWGVGILAGLQRYDWATAVSIGMTTVSTVGSLLAVYLLLGVVGVVIANVAGAVFSLALYGWCVHRLLSHVRWSLSFDWPMFKHIFSFGIFSTLQVVFGIIATQLDRTLLGIWIGVAAVTTYSIPLAVATRIHQLSAKALEVVMPISSGLDARGATDQLKRLFLRAQNLNMVLVAMVSVPLLVLAPEVLRFWIGADFAAEATLVFQLLVVAYALLGLSVVMAAIVAGLGHPGFNTAYAIVLALGNLVGYVLFIPRWGVNGAGLASVLGSVVALTGYVSYCNLRLLRISFAEILWTATVRPVLAGIIVGVALLAIRPFVTNTFFLLFVLAAYCPAYLGATIGLAVWQPRELHLARQAWQQVRTRLSPRGWQGDEF